MYTCFGCQLSFNNQSAWKLEITENISNNYQYQINVKQSKIKKAMIFSANAVNNC